jgi:hypothetical protein
MKTNRIHFIIIVLIICSLSSCEKIINLNLDTSATEIVIVGNVFDHIGPYQVMISKTINFTESNIFPPITGAKVTISDNAGHTNILTETSSGKYTTSTLKGIPGLTYTLTVETEGKTFTATSTMPNPVNIDRIYIKRSTVGNEKEITVDFKDPDNIDNYYRVIEYINDTLKTGINVGTDKLYQGKIIDYSLGSTALDDKTSLKNGDRVKVQLECIDKDVFEYFRTSRGNDGQSTSPANPVSNINNGALGYFSACSVREASITVP